MSEPASDPSPNRSFPWKQHWALWAAWAISLGAAFLLGIALAPQPTPSVPAAGDPPVSASPAQAPSDLPESPPPVSYAELRAHLSRSTDPAVQADLHRRIAALSLTEVIALVDEVRANPGPQKRRMLGLLFERWGQLDGHGAVLAAEQLRRGPDTRLTTRALRGWIREDPAAALAWAREHGSSDGGIPSGLLGSLVEYHGWRAIDFVAGQSPDIIATTRNFLIQQLLQQGRLRDAAAAAESWFDPTLPSTTAYVENLATTWADWDPFAAARWLNEWQNRHSLITSSLPRILHLWGGQDPISALAWIDRTVEAPDAYLQELRAATFRGWVWSGTEAARDAATWLNGRQTDPVDDPLRELLADHYQMRDPAAAMAWAASIIDESKRAGVAGWILSTWRDRAPEEAAEWVSAHGHELIGGVTAPLSIELDGQTVYIQPTTAPLPAP